MNDGRKSTSTEIANALREEKMAAETTVSVNPLTGFRFRDLTAVGTRLAATALRRPLVFAKHAVSQNLKLLGIVTKKANYSPERHDWRFRDPSFENSWFYRNLMQGYLALVETVHEWVDDLDLEDVDRDRADILLRVIGESVAPTNTLIGNPAAMRRAIETRGDSLAKGFVNLLDDVVHNHGIPSQVDASKFEVGKSIACSDGAVVFRNDILELIQYTPTTSDVHQRPLLFISAMINKFYALDLTPNRSMIKYCLDQGMQTYVVSWRNPRRQHARWGISEYAAAIIEAVEAIREISGADDINVFTLCSGAMVSLAAFAYLAAVDRHVINSLTVGVCMMDMQPEDGDFGAFASNTMLDAVKRRSRRKQILRGHELALAMLWLRPNDLIWINVVNNYLLGNDPPAFDLLYWNNDWTNLTSSLHCDFVDMFWSGSLIEKDAMSVFDAPLDLGAIRGDKFIFGGLTDHITPWNACYRGCQAFDGNVEFLLSNSGHMQTMLNAPGRKKSSYFVNGDTPDQPQDWLEDSTFQEGSWWDYWMQWLGPRAGQLQPAPESHGSALYTTICPAPGEYVFEQAE